jgi:hypothetical protein
MNLAGQMALNGLKARPEVIEALHVQRWIQSRRHSGYSIRTAG